MSLLLGLNQVDLFGLPTTVNRDADGRTVSTQNALGNFNTTVFDNASRPIANVSPLGIIQTTVWDIANQQIGAQNGLGYIYTSTRDAAGRIIATTNPLGYISSVVFDSASQPVASIDSLGNYATNIWSPNGMQIATQNELGYLTSFILDAASQRICVVDANNGRSTTVFDVRGLESVRQDQIGNLTSFSHDPNGNTILRVDGRSWPTTYTIDPLNRTVQTLYIDSTRVTNSWDNANQQISSSDVTGTYTHAFDLDGRKYATMNPTGIGLTQTLDRLGNRLVLQDNYGVTSYSWDQQNRLLSIWNPVNERTSITWDNLDREQHRVLGNGMSISHTWDPAGRETVIGNYGPSGVGLAIFTNSYSPVDNRLTVLELDSTRATYTYDASRQIVSEARGGTMAYSRSYVWDPLGNRIQQFDSGVLTSGTFNKANQQTLITPATGAPTTQSFDGAGNLVMENAGGSLTTQTWTPENRLSSKIAPSGVTKQLLYSDDGLRNSVFDGATTTMFTYDEQALLLQTDVGGNLELRCTGYPGIWGGLASIRHGSSSSFHGFDSQHSVRILVSSAGVVTDAYSWKAFGEPLQGGSGTVNPFGYIGLFLYYTDADGSIAVGPRILRVAIGTWMPRDPIGFGGGTWNLYQYVFNSPLDRADPSGLAPVITPSCGKFGDVGGALGKCCSDFKGALPVGGGGSSPAVLAVIQCLADKGFDNPAMRNRVREAISWINGSCSDAKRVCIWCVSDNSTPTGWPPGCKNACPNQNNVPGSGSVAFNPLPALPDSNGYTPILPDDTRCSAFFSAQNNCDALRTAPDGGRCDTAIALCYDASGASKGWNCGTLYHEMTHGGGIGEQSGHHGKPRPGGGADPRDDFVFALACCLCQQAQKGDAKACAAQCGFWDPAKPKA